MSAAHTPGPWVASFSSPPTIDGDIDGGVLVCEMPMWQPIYHGERDANALLIAAAPDLLKALEWVRDNPIAHPENRKAVVNDVIAKATGNA